MTPGISGPPAESRLQIAVLERIPGAGTLVAGWLVDPSHTIKAIMVGDGNEPATDLRHDAVFPVSRGLSDAFGILPEIAVSCAFILYQPDVAREESTGLRCEIHRAGGAIEQCCILPVGHFSECGRIFDIAPLGDALHLARQMLNAWRAHSCESPPLPAILWTWLSRLHARIGHEIGNAGRVVTAVRFEPDGILLHCCFARNGNITTTAIAVASLSGYRAPVETFSAVLAPSKAAAVHDTPAGDPEGFVAFARVPGCPCDDRLWFIEINGARGSIERVPFVCMSSPPPRDIEAALALTELPTPDRHRLLEKMIAPAVDALWRAARRDASAPLVMSFGNRCLEPEVSVIIPLNRELEQMRHQLAHFSNDQDFRPGGIVELIYVLDNDAVAADFSEISQNLHDIYGVAFRILVLEGGTGRAIAANHGAAVASGDMLLFLDANVLPKQSRWVGHLLASYRSLDHCSVLGCRLLFEDETIHHCGITFQVSPTMPGSWEEHRPCEGLPHTLDPACGPERAIAVTSACMMVKTQLFRRLGGFCEQYVFGDCADLHLCLDAYQQDGYAYYTPEIELYQLLAPTPDPPRWRRQAEQYNRWKCSSKWASLIATLVAG